MAQVRSPSISLSIMSGAIEPPRGLVLAAGAWVVAAAVLSFGVQLPLQVTPASLTPAIRMFLATCSAGMLIAWPLLRLSQTPVDRPVLRALIDAITLACLFQVLIWPLRLATPWPLERTVLIDLSVLGQLGAVFGIVAAGTAFRHSIVRAAAMSASIVIALGLELPMAAMGSPLDPARADVLSGIAGLLELMEAQSSTPTETDWSQVRSSATWELWIGLIGLVVGWAIAARSPGRASRVATMRPKG